MLEYIAFPEKRAYGVELELDYYPISKETIASRIREVDLNHRVTISNWTTNNNNINWYVKEDSSCGWEVASYKCKGIADLLNIAKVAQAIKDHGGVINVRCGLHIHVEVKDFSPEQIATLVAYWMKIEPVIKEALPPHRLSNKYCQLLREHYSQYANKSDLSSKEFWDTIRPDSYGDARRRVALNIVNYTRAYDYGDNSRKTVELRLPEGTLSAYEVKNWVRFFVRFVSFCRKQNFPRNTVTATNLIDALQILGLHGREDSFFLLSKGMRTTKEWFLYRIMQYSHNKYLSKQAVGVLNFMWNPLKSYEISKDGSVFTEFV